MKIYLVDKWRNVSVGADYGEGSKTQPFAVMDALLSRNMPQNGQGEFRVDREFRATIDLSKEKGRKVDFVDWGPGDGGGRKVGTVYCGVPIEIID